MIVSYHIYNGPQLRWAENEQLVTANPDDVVQQYAEGLLKRLNPYLWAVYLGWNKHDYPGAIAEANKIIRETHDKLSAQAHNLDPRFALAYNNWGLSLYHQGKKNEANVEFRKAAELDPMLTHP